MSHPGTWKPGGRLEDGLGCDIAIVGAGMVGVMAAYLAARRYPGRRIFLIDRGFAGGGATLYSGGHDHPHGANARQKRLAGESRRIFSELREWIPDLPAREVPLVGITSIGSLSNVLDGFVVDGAGEATAEQEAWVRSHVPDLRIGAEQTIVAGCMGGYGIPGAMARVVAGKLAAEKSITLLEGVEISSIDTSGEHVRLRVADGRTLVASRVILAPGPWALSGPFAGLTRSTGVRIKKVVAMHVDLMPASDAPILYFYDEDCYLLPTIERGGWIFSFASREWDVRPEPSMLRVTGPDREIADTILRRYLPSFADRALGGRVFCDAYSQDRSPIVRPVSDHVVFAGGCSGYGYRLAPAIAAEALERLSPPD